MKRCIQKLHSQRSRRRNLTWKYHGYDQKGPMILNSYSSFIERISNTLELGIKIIQTPRIN